ncbi:hypothetical protein K435DRAFT_861773 [Dendrothele bispora CBS 962.96]|uniref:Uncharacterized protein n=1 Tax=Dendrothele bispora (strain CBS 962.96) TaxID=1314807 RepID=A0A4S8LU87_DENBC|nr:hypothetical protein K435DRAFT_861773 [Dendrothele bispora CBS 962.96]
MSSAQPTSQPASIPLTQFAANTRQKANWTINNDRTLLGCLKDAKHGGFQTDNGGFHADAFKTAAHITEEVGDLDNGSGQAAKTPTCKSKAISMIEVDGELSDHSMTKAFQLVS